MYFKTLYYVFSLFTLVPTTNQLPMSQDVLRVKSGIQTLNESLHHLSEMLGRHNQIHSFQTDNVVSKISQVSNRLLPSASSASRFFLKTRKSHSKTTILPTGTKTLIRVKAQKVTEKAGRGLKGSHKYTTPNLSVPTTSIVTSFKSLNMKDASPNPTSYSSMIVSWDHRDDFRCGQCLCSYNNHRFVRANCTYRHLPLFPRHLPIKTIKLDLSNNMLEIVNQSAIVVLKNLLTLSMRRNHIKKVVVNTTEISNIEMLDLGFNQIQELDDKAFSFLTNLKNLSLTYNRLKYIRKGTFSSLVNLRVLDLSINVISRFDGMAFDSLTDLRELYLQRNPGMGYFVTHFPPRLFNSLKNLRVLFIQGSSNGDQHYPLEILAKIKYLEHLNIDIVPLSEFLGPEVLNLKRLTTLEIGPHAICHLHTISRNFFQYVPYLKALSITNCVFHGLDPRAYAYLPELKKLSFKDIKSYDLNTALSDLKGIQNSSIKSLHLNHLTSANSDQLCVSLNGSNAKYLTNLTLFELDLSRNRIALIQDDFIRELPSTLRKLVLSQNVLTMKGEMWNRMRPLGNLTELDVSDQNMMKYFEFEEMDIFPQRILMEKLDLPNNKSGNHRYEISKNNSYELQVISQGYRYRSDDHWSIQGMDQQTNQQKTLTNSVHTCYVAKSLKNVKASNYNFFGESIFRSRCKNHFHLEYLYFANSLLTEWGKGSIPSSVKFVDVSKNYCQYISKRFFPRNNSLLHISMSDNFLGAHFAMSHDHYFLHLNKTRYMDLSLNFIFKLPFHFFKGLITLETLKMTDNRLQDLNISFLETPNLKMLDVRRNSISWISEETRLDLDKIVSNHSLTLAIVNNPIPCTCGGIEIIKWMALTRVHLLDKDLLKCRDERGRISLMGDLSLLHQNLQRRCADKITIIEACGISGFLFSLFIAGYFLWRKYRWLIYYKTNVWFAKRFGFKPKLKERPTKKYRYDGYLCYTDKDRSLAIEIANKLDNSHPLFIPDRQIPYGTDEVRGMTSGITNSYKFLLILTENLKENLRNDFKEFGMLEYAINMALYEERLTKRKCFHVIKYADLNDVKVPLYLAQVLQDGDRSTNFPTSEDLLFASPDAMECAWGCLSTQIDQMEMVEGDPHELEK